MENIIPVEKPITLQAEGVIEELGQVVPLVKAREVHEQKKVFGKGIGVAVLDTGIYAEHLDFQNRVLPGYDAIRQVECIPVDQHGHGTHVASIIAAYNEDYNDCTAGRHKGIAPHAQIVPIKVLNDEGKGKWSSVLRGLNWLWGKKDDFPFKLGAICMSLNEDQLEITDAGYSDTRIFKQFKKFQDHGIAVVVTAGNYYHQYQKEGMLLPAISRDCISVGSVYDEDMPNERITQPPSYRLAEAKCCVADQITPYSNRLSEKNGGDIYTTVFAPGSVTTAASHKGEFEQSTLQGTSQAAPVVAGGIALLQEYYFAKTNRMPSIEQLKSWIRNGKQIYDDPTFPDNVAHTGEYFVRLDLMQAINSIQF